MRLAGVHAGIKKRKTDLAVIAFDEPHVCASVVTTNEIKAAPLVVSDRASRFDGEQMGAIVCNAGCANACTGERGLRDARATARQAATLLGIATDASRRRLDRRHRRLLADGPPLQGPRTRR